MIFYNGDCVKKLKPATKFSYAIGNLGYGTIAQTVSSFIMFFGTSVLGVPGTLVGIAIAISAFWDGISDPIVGYLSDRTTSKVFGKRLGYLLFATLGMCIVNIVLWLIPVSLGNGLKFVWILISLILLETCNTLFATPYVALGIDLAPDYNEQASLQGLKTVFFIIGMILPSVLMIIFMPSSSNTQSQFMQNGYVNISYVTSSLALISGALCIIGTFKASKDTEHWKAPKKEKNAFFKIFYNFFKTLKHKHYGPIIIGYSVALISASLLTSVGMHLFTYSFHFTSTQISILMTVLFIGAIISQLFWIYLSKRIDKKNSLNTALIVILIGILLISIIFIFRNKIPSAYLFYITIPCILFCGFGTGALYSLPVSMFADAITVDKMSSGENKSATYSGFMTLAYSISNSLSLLIIGVLLDLIKFNPREPVQPLRVQNLLGVIVFLGCALSIGISMFIFSKYKLTRSQILKAQMKNKEK